MKVRAWALIDLLKTPFLYLMGFQTARSLSRAIAMIMKQSQLRVMLFMGFKKCGNRST